MFAKPHEEHQPFTTFLSYLTAQENHPPQSPSEPSPPLGKTTTITTATTTTTTATAGTEIRYAQTQNDNLRHEYRTLFAAVPPSIPWARIALARDPDAINLWIGNSRSVTALHKDNYENVYVQVAGRKHFVLLPPVCQPAVGERALRSAVYVRGDTDGKEEGKDGQERKEKSGREGRSELKLVLEGEDEVVPFATWDPDRPEENVTPYSALVQPMRVTLNPGDMLYLPCMWWVPRYCAGSYFGDDGKLTRRRYHKVAQSCSPEGVCIAVNYWWVPGQQSAWVPYADLVRYDMDFTGPLYPLSTFVRSVANKGNGARQRQA